MKHVRWFLLLTVLLGAVPLVPVKAAAQAAPPAANADDPLRFRTGQMISLDLKGVDIVDVLKLLSQKGNLNFVAGRNVSGRVTIFAKDVDVWDAFELIVSSNDLAYEIKGDLINIMTARDYELLYGQKFNEPFDDEVRTLKHAKVVQVATVLNQLKSAIGRVVADEASNTIIISDIPERMIQMRSILNELDRPTGSKVYSLNYADAEKLQEKVTELLSPVGTFNFDVRSNKVIVNDLPEIIEKTDQLIRAFDVPDGQVLIEAKIVKVELNEDQSLGIDWTRVFSGVDGRLRGNFSVLGDVIGGTETGVALQIASSRGDYALLIEALETVGKTDTLANPRIMVSNNQEAKILVGTKEATVTTTTTVPSTGSVVSSPQIQYVDVGTKLFVTPNVKRDGRIQLKIRPEVSTATIETFADNRIPIVTTTEAETTVLVKSGVTLIIGGLIDHSNSDTVSKIPILGDLPYVGFPFRSKIKDYAKTELVVFLTPQIIHPDGTPYEPALQATAFGSVGMPDVTIQDPVPSAYRARVRQQLEALFRDQFQLAQLSAGSVVVAFVVGQDGRVLNIDEIESPQGESFENAARTALLMAKQIPPFPEGVEAQEVRFRMAVEYVPGGAALREQDF